jgi:hypothetical protein
LTIENEFREKEQPRRYAELGKVIHIVNIALKAWEKLWLEPLGHVPKDDSRATSFCTVSEAE